MCLCVSGSVRPCVCVCVTTDQLPQETVVSAFCISASTLNNTVYKVFWGLHLLSKDFLSMKSESDSHSVLSDSLRPCGL